MLDWIALGLARPARLALALLLWVSPGQPLPAQATELETILERGYVVVGVKDNLPPLGYRDAQGRLVGFEIELAQRLAQSWFGDAGAVRFTPLANRDRLAALLSGEVDLLLAQVTVTGDRARLVQFSPPYYQSGIAILTDQPGLQTLADLRDQRLAVLEGSSSIAVVRSRLPRLTLVLYPSYAAALAGLGQGEADAIAADAAVLAGWRQQYPEYYQLGPLLSTAPLAIALPKGLQHEPLRQRLGQTLDQWQADGWLERQRQRWQLF